MTPTAIVLPHREAFSVVRPGAVALTVAEQLRHCREVSVWGDPLDAMALLPDQPYVPLHTSWWWWGRQRLRYRWAILRAVRQCVPLRLEIHNRASLFHELRDESVGLSLYVHNEPNSIKGLKTAQDRIRILARADYVAAVSEYVKQRLCMGVPDSLADKVLVVPNTVDLQAFSPADERMPEILFVGRLIPEKGALPLIEALCRVLPEFPDWRARLIGAWHFGQNRPQYAHEHELVRRVPHALVGRIQFDWYQPYVSVQQAFSRAAIAVVPSLWQEPFGRTALEAMASGCALIVAPRGGLPEVVGNAGLLVEPTAVLLAEAIRQLIRDEELRKNLGEQARQRACTVFDPQGIHARINALRLA